MYALNRVQIIGHLTETPNVRQTPSGQTVGDLNVITRDFFINSQGQKQALTAYHNVVVWRGLADIAQRFLRKGSQIYIEGRIQTDEWVDQTSGQKRYKARITADNMILLDPKTPYPASPANSVLSGALNKAEIIGNVTRDPELRQTPNGNQVVSFGVATNYSWKDRAGAMQEKTEFHNVVAWGALAEAIQQTCHKGRKVYIEGRLQTRSWDTPDGNKRYTTEIIAEKALALGVPDAEIGAPEGVSVSAAVAATGATMGNPFDSVPMGGQSMAPENPMNVPPVNYESEIKPEDLPF